MHSSRPIEVRGRFIGVAIAQPSPARDGLWRFIATDPAAEDLDGATFPSPAEATRVAGLVLARNGGLGADRLAP